MDSKNFNNDKEKEYISEKELIEIFKIQYNDIFHNLLRFEQKKIMNLLQEQVYLHLKIINKVVDYSLNQKILSLFLKQYLNDKEKVLNSYKIIKKNSINIIYLDYLNCFIHCPKCKNALHICGNNFIVYNDYVFCLLCNVVYNEFQVHMYCKECNEEYYTKLREIKDEKKATIFPASYEKYHCPSLNFEEKIECIQCKNILYLDINSDKNKKEINQIFCNNCKCIYNVNKMNFICSKCNCSFKSKVKIYTFFTPSKIDLLCAIHSLNKNKYVLPFIIKNKYCKCDLANIEMLKHHDGGDLLEGDKLDKKVIVCNKCFGVFSMDSFDWACPICNKGFGIKKFNITEYRYKICNINNMKNKYLNSYSNRTSIENSNYGRKNIMKKLNFFTRNNSNKKRYILINYFSSDNREPKKKEKLINTERKNSYNSNKRIHKNCKSISYSAKKNNFLKTEKKKVNIIKKYNTKFYSRNDNNNMHLNKKDNEENETFNYYKKGKLMYSSDKISSLLKHYKQINILNLTFEEKNKFKKNLNYINYSNTSKNDTNKKKSFEKILDDKKNMIHNYSQKHSHYFKNIKDYIINYAKNNYYKANKYNTNQTSVNLKKNYKINDNNFTHEPKSDKKSNYIKKFNIINISQRLVNYKRNNNRKVTDNDLKNNSNYFGRIMDINKNTKKNYNDKNISINTKINNNNNNNNSIMNISNNYIKKDISFIKLNNKNINENSNINELTKIKSIRKNCIHIVTNLNKSMQSNIKENKRKNQIHIISNLNYKNNISKRKNNIHIITNINKSNNNLSKSQICQNKSFKKIYENEIQEEKLENNISIKNFQKNIFHSDDYNIIKPIGQGAFGKIYLVKKNKTNEVYALKQIALKDREDLNCKKEEFEFLMKLTEENPELNIIKVLGIEVKKLDKFCVVLYVLMEAGKCDWEKELHQRNKEKRYYKENELINILISLVDTFSVLQEKGISHRDVKPQNILYIEEDKNKSVYKITDFGEAKLKLVKKNKYLDMSFEKNTNKQTLRGTELYMSPLLFNALRNTGEIDVQYNPYKSDVFSLGLCMLLASSLSYIPLYDIREIKNMDKMKSIIEGYLIKRYSKKFINLILLMLELNEKLRPDFIQLKSYINKNHFI